MLLIKIGVIYINKFVNINTKNLFDWIASFLAMTGVHSMNKER